MLDWEQKAFSDLVLEPTCKTTHCQLCLQTQYSAASTGQHSMSSPQPQLAPDHSLQSKTFLMLGRVLSGEGGMGGASQWAKMFLTCGDLIVQITVFPPTYSKAVVN